MPPEIVDTRPCNVASCGYEKSANDELVAGASHQLSRPEFPSTTYLNFAVNGHFPRLNQKLCVSAGHRGPADLQKMIQSQLTRVIVQTVLAVC